MDVDPTDGCTPDASQAPVSPVRVAVVNDYQLIVEGLAALLANFEDRVVVVELDSGAPVTSDVDVVLYDTFAQSQGAAIDPMVLSSLDPATRLVVFTWNADPAVVHQTRQAGASALVSKSADAEELVGVLERVHAGQRVFPTGATNDEPVRAGRWPGQEHGLSARESEVLALVCQGLANQEIAGRAFLGINTIKTYIRSTYRKIGVTTRAQAVIWGLSHGFEPDHVSRVLRPPQD